MENSSNTERTIKYKTTINCGGCVKAVTPSLEKVEGINQWEVDTENKNKILTVKYSGNNDIAIEKAVEKAGFKAEKINGN